MTQTLDSPVADPWNPGFPCFDRLVGWLPEFRISIFSFSPLWERVLVTVTLLKEPIPRARADGSRRQNTPTWCLTKYVLVEFWTSCS